MSYAGFPYCRRMFKKTFWETMRDRRVTFSCTYYWKNIHLVKPFIRGISDSRYDIMFKTGASAMENFDIDPRNINGTTMTKDEYLQSNIKNNVFGNFPYDLFPSNICQYCTSRDPDPNKTYDY